MYYWMIVSDPEIAVHIVDQGVDRIFVDLESLGKSERQGHVDMWKSGHSLEDVVRLRPFLSRGRLLVRLNPWNPNSSCEIEAALAAGADWLMLPMFRCLDELQAFCIAVDGRAPVIPLVETGEALDLLPQVAQTPGVAEIYIGLNDLRLSLGLKFLFEPLVNGLLDQAAETLNNFGMPWGFGGLARYGEGLLPAEMILVEHRRLGSSRVILSRTFHRMAITLEELEEEMDFEAEIDKLTQAEARWRLASAAELDLNHRQVVRIITRIVEGG